MNWQLVSFGEAPFEIIDGDRGKNYPKQNDFSDSGHCLFLSATNVTKSGFDFSSCQFINEERDLALKKGKLQREDIVLTTRGTVGNTAYFNDSIPFENLRINSGMVIFRCDLSQLVPAYLYYFVRSSSFFSQVNGLRSGVAQPQLPIRDMKRIMLPLPPLPVQRRIAGILLAYDELIENNQRRIRILEEMAQSLYREWFVHFRFPNHENHPLIVSPFGEVPQGWEVKSIGDTFRTVLGGTPSRTKPEFWKGGTISWINSGKVNDLRITEPSELITPLAVERSAVKLMPKGTTVLAITGATLGQVSYLEIETTANQSVVGIVDPTGLLAEWIYLTICHRIEGIIKHASGGAQQHINKEIVNNVQVCLPPHSIALSFKTLVAPMFREVATLLFQLQNLRRTRDLLLPRLLSGQIDVEAIPS